MRVPAPSVGVARMERLATAKLARCGKLGGSLAGSGSTSTDRNCCKNKNSPEARHLWAFYCAYLVGVFHLSQDIR
jgi:hypothetical protein